MSFIWFAVATAWPLATPLQACASNEDSNVPPKQALVPVASAILDFDAIYERHFDFVWRSLRRLGIDSSSVDDAAHDVFLVVYRQLAEFDGGNYKSWLFAIAQRVAWHYRRAYARRKTEPLAEDSLQDVGTSGPEQSHQQREAVDLAHLLLEQLPDDRRAVFVLSELEQLSMPEIAQILRIPLNTAYSRLRLARRDFSCNLKRHEQKFLRSAP